MAKGQKTLSVRIDADDYSFLNRLAAAEHDDISKAVRDLVGRGRVMLAIERYRQGKASIGKAAEIAGLSLSETMDLLAEFGIEANLDPGDYLRSLESSKKAW